MEIDYKAIGQRIKIARIKKGITQEAVADLIDITPAHMSNVETGKTKVSLPTLIEIANALSVSVDFSYVIMYLLHRIFSREKQKRFLRIATNTKPDF